MEKFIRFTIVTLLAVAPASAIAFDTGMTYQCWDFEEDTQGGILPNAYTNPYPGNPTATINDLSGTGVSWDNGTWTGKEFMILLNIPNRPETNPYKELALTMRYQGEVAFSWVTEIEYGEYFDFVTEEETEIDDWQTLNQWWYIEPNPRGEIVVIGLQGIDSSDAVLDSICVETVCAPEPATLALLGLGVFGVMRRKRNNA